MERLLVPTYPEIPANLAADCDGPVVIGVGDSIPQAAAENAARLRDCRERHKKAVQAVKPV